MHGQRTMYIQLGVKCEVSCNEWLIPRQGGLHYTVTRLAAAELWIVNTKTTIGTKTPHSSFLIFAFCTFTSGLKHFDLDSSLSMERREEMM